MMVEPVAPLRVGEEPPPIERSAAGLAPHPPSKASALTRDRFAVINGFVDHSLRELSRAEVVVWLILWRETRPPGVAQVAQDVIADRAGIDVRTVRRAIERLKDLGLVEIVSTGSLRRGPSYYRAHPFPRRAD